MTDEKLTIHQIIPKIRQEVGAVRKDQTAQAGARYSYRSGDQVINALVPALDRYGVFTTVEDVEHDLHERVLGSKVVTVAKLRKKVTFWAGDGSHVSSTVAAESSDYADKATGAAQSYAYRYALLQTFTLPTDETDPDAKYEEKTIDSKPAPATAPAQNAAPAVPQAVTELKDEITKLFGQRGVTEPTEIGKQGAQFFNNRTGWETSLPALKKLRDALRNGEDLSGDE